MLSRILGLDIGGANLKAATPDARAASMPFALWKQPDGLPLALAELLVRFPETEELAVTVTGELCDCFETKRVGVLAILGAVRIASKGRAIRVWTTDGVFVDSEEAERRHLKVAAANWHALATFAGRFALDSSALLLDIGTTTSDVIPLVRGEPLSLGKTDWERLQSRELVYLGVRRTPVAAVYPDRVCAELFATTQDVYLALGSLAEDLADADTADGRPATVANSLARLARMLGADREVFSDERIVQFARRVDERICKTLVEAIEAAFFSRNLRKPHALILSGAGEFLARRLIEKQDLKAYFDRIISLNETLGQEVSACAPAYAAAVLAEESRA